MTNQDATIALQPMMFQWCKQSWCELGLKFDLSETIFQFSCLLWLLCWCKLGWRFIWEWRNIWEVLVTLVKIKAVICSPINRNVFTNIHFCQHISPTSMQPQQNSSPHRHYSFGKYSFKVRKHLEPIYNRAISWLFQIQIFSDTVVCMKDKT